MPKIDPDLRAKLCAFIYPSGRRCRLPHAASCDGYCYAHARKIRAQRESEHVVQLITEPIAHPAIASTNLTFMLSRLFTAVAEGCIPPKTATALLRVADAIRRTIPDTKREFYSALDARKLNQTIRRLYEEQANFLFPEEGRPSASATPPPTGVDADLAPFTLPVEQAADPAANLSVDALLQKVQKLYAKR